MDITGTAKGIQQIASEPANWLLASTFWASITTTHKAWAALATVAFMSFAAGGTMVASTSGLLRAPEDLAAHVARTDSTFVAHRARTDSIFAEHKVRLDSLDLASLRRSEGTREMIRELRDEIRVVQDSVTSVGRFVGDLACALGARAEGQQPEAICRDPLPLVPLLD